ncbi:capsular exopolysaccharide synthesis family protein [Gillisia sp. Hel_I_86]|uniref:GumC family protein n=1 Tax=Gillisia sp. Hel_I_86 TaxID=1249981 RepID=UPI0011998EF8|nr:polysaccharide biosynthesis tyrosine autokinase [Gillisia sp. Hel_I_86]TVZ27518.1 capsular exopolysaccharide synthesis family protein [Gillisia sp. Hel_I_86]
MSYNNKSAKNENLFSSMMDLFFPFWPLLAVILVVVLFLAWGYKNYATPIYEVSATLIIKDENKGVDNSKMVESMSPFDSKKIVENEIKVIQSPDIMKKVVDTLNLYAPVYEEKDFFGLNIKSVSAYNSSPIQIKLKNPDEIVIEKDVPAEHYFTVDFSKKNVKVDGRIYPLNEWVDSPFGKIMFYPNKNKVQQAKKPLYFILINPRSVTQSLLKSLEVAPPEKLSTVINLYLQDAVPNRGEDILNGIIAAYNQNGIEDKNILAANTMKFIEARIRNIGNELDTLESENEQYRSSKGVVDLSQQSRIYLQDAGHNDQRIADIRLKLSVLDKVENYILSKDGGGSIVPSTLGIDDPVLTQLLQKLYNSEIEYERLKKTTAVNNPMLTSLADEINKIRPNILDNVQSQKSNLNASLSNLYSNSGKYTSALQTIPEKERKLLEITRRRAVKQEIFASLLQKREEIALSFMPTNGQDIVVTSAQASLEPVSPKGIKIYGIAIFLGAGLWIAYVTGKEMMNKKILFRSEIEESTNLPVIGELSYLKGDKQLSLNKPEDIPFIEQFRQLDAQLGLYSRTFRKKKILVTSSLSGEGKSFVSKNLAYSLAQTGKKVVLLDMDFRKPNATKAFNLKDHKGIVDYLKGEASLDSIVITSELDTNLDILPAGTKGGDHTQLLLNGKLELLFEKLSERYDYVIMDSAPIGLISDANLLAEFSEITLLVVRHGFTPKKIVRRLDQNLGDKNLQHIGIIFNGLKKRGLVKEDSGYGYGYGQAYGYGAYVQKR